MRFRRYVFDANTFHTYTVHSRALTARSDPKNIKLPATKSAQLHLGKTPVYQWTEPHNAFKSSTFDPS